jgi:hypothetical protein
VFPNSHWRPTKHRWSDHWSDQKGERCVWTWILQKLQVKNTIYAFHCNDFRRILSKALVCHDQPLSHMMTRLTPWDSIIPKLLRRKPGREAVWGRNVWQETRSLCQEAFLRLILPPETSWTDCIKFNCVENDQILGFSSRQYLHITSIETRPIQRQHVQMIHNHKLRTSLNSLYKSPKFRAIRN